jgi:hypothetical protein
MFALFLGRAVLNCSISPQKWNCTNVIALRFNGAVVMLIAFVG